LLTVSASYGVPESPADVLWFRVPEPWSDAIDRSVNPFVIAFVLKAAMEGRDFHINGAADTVLLANLDELIGIWNAWRPDSMHLIRISADSEELRDSSGSDAVCCASGGIDSCFTIWRHTIGRGVARPERLKAGIYVHGFDIAIEDEFGARQALNSVEAIVKSVGIESILVTTNYRKVIPEWEVTFGTAACSVLALFAARFGRGLIAGSGDPFISYAWGSTPMTDPLLSSSAMLIKSDGIGIRRHLKTHSMASWPALHRHVEVCWENRTSGRNCGRCEKCIRTYYALRAAGVRDPAAFPNPPTIRDIQNLEIPHEFHLDYMSNIILLAESSGLGTEDWVLALKTRVAHGRREFRGGFSGSVNRICRKSWRKLTT
jgi:hypothetical protein